MNIDILYQESSIFVLKNEDPEKFSISDRIPIVNHLNNYSRRKNTLIVTFHTVGHSLRGLSKESPYQKYFLDIRHDYLFCNLLKGFGLIPNFSVVKNNLVTIHETIHHHNAPIFCNSRTTRFQPYPRFRTV